MLRYEKLNDFDIKLKINKVLIKKYWCLGTAPKSSIQKKTTALCYTTTSAAMPYFLPETDRERIDRRYFLLPLPIFSRLSQMKHLDTQNL